MQNMILAGCSPLVGASIPGPRCHPSQQRRALLVRAVSSNGSAPGLEATKQGTAAAPTVEMLEMVVADDLRPQNGAANAARAPTKRLVPAPHTSAAVVPAKPDEAPAVNGHKPLGGAANGTNGSGPQLPPVVQSLVSRQASSNRTASAELALAYRQMQEQKLELQETKKELAAREAEVVSLKQELAERDGKLKAARADALESRMALQQMEGQLKAAYAELSEAVRDRSAMRSQLAQTHAELAETRAELEQLADDILAIKLLMDEEAELNGAAAANGASVDGTAGLPSSYAAGGSAGGRGAEDLETLDILNSLAALSRQLVQDAAQDDAALLEAERQLTAQDGTA